MSKVRPTQSTTRNALWRVKTKGRKAISLYAALARSIGGTKPPQMSDVGKKIPIPKQPRRLDIKGRALGQREKDILYPHLEGIYRLTQTTDMIRNRIREAEDIQAAHVWVQWLLNVALGNYDDIREWITNPDGRKE